MARGRRGWSVKQKKAFSLRLYGAITEAFRNAASSRHHSAFQWFVRELGRRGAKTASSTIRNWLPPLERLDVDPRGGSGVSRADWAALKTPDLVQLAEVASLFGFSVDFLLGRDVPLHTAEREPPGELALALRDDVRKRFAMMPSWEAADLVAADEALPEGRELLQLVASLLGTDILPRVHAAWTARFLGIYRAEKQREEWRQRAPTAIHRAYLTSSPSELAEAIGRAARPPVAPPRSLRLMRPRRQSS